MCTLADTLAEVVALKFGKKLGGLDTEALVNTVANRLANVNRETLLARLSDVRVKTLMAVLNYTITVVYIKTLCHTLDDVEA